MKKNKLDNYAENFDYDDGGKLIKTDDIPKKDKEKLEKIRTKVVDTYTTKAQEKITEDTNKVIKTKAVAALLQNIGQYFQIDNFAKDFNVDLKSGIEFDKDLMKLSGTMEGKEMSFYYDIKAGTVRADDFSHYNQDDKTFYIDRGKKDSKGREKLPLNMPTLENVLKDSETAITTAMPDALKDTDKLDDYGTKLNETAFTIDKKNESSADIVIEHSMAKNIAIQETHDFLQKYMPTRKEYSYDKVKQEYNLYYIMDTSLNRYTTEEIKTRRNLLTRFNAKISEEQNPTFKDEMISGMFNQKIREKDINQKYDTDK